MQDRAYFWFSGETPPSIVATSQKTLVDYESLFGMTCVFFSQPCCFFSCLKRPHSLTFSVVDDSLVSAFRQVLLGIQVPYFFGIEEHPCKEHPGQNQIKVRDQYIVLAEAFPCLLKELK